MAEESVEVETEEAPKSALAKFRSRWWGRLLVDMVMIGCIFYGITAFQGWALLGSGKQAPVFSLKSTDGTTVDLEKLRGQKVLLVFWAPWCGVCGAESGNLSSVYQANQGEDDPKVVSVVLGYSGLDSVHKFMEENAVDYPVLLGNSALGEAYKINKFPTAYVISETGEIESSMVGYTTELGMRLRLLL